MKAYLGLYTARLETPARSLKEKRALIKPALERLKARFPVSAARLYGLDAWGYEVVGFTLLGNDPAWVEETMRAAARFLAEAGGFQVALEEFRLEASGRDGLLKERPPTPAPPHRPPSPRPRGRWRRGPAPPPSPARR